MNTEQRHPMEDPRFREADMAKQVGDWDTALAILRQLKEEYPNQPEIDSLIQEAELRLDMAEKWGVVDVEGRKSPFRPKRLLGAALFILFLAFIGAGAYYLYANFIAPRQAEARAFDHLQQTLDDAQVAILDEDYERAIELYERVLALDPENEAALKGKEYAEEQLDARQMYEKAGAAFEQGDYSTALSLYMHLEEKHPGYRDVSDDIAKVKEILKAQNLFYQAESAYGAEDWEEAIDLYKELRRTAGDYRAEIVEQRLFDAYRRYAQFILSKSLRTEGAPDIAPVLDNLRKALALRPGDAEIRREIQNLEQFEKGLIALEEGEPQTALDVWLPLYEQQPDYMDGYLAQQIFNIYMQLGDEAMQRGERMEAITYYKKAGEMPLPDASTEASLRIEAIAIYLTPSPTPTPTPTPTPPSPSPTPGPTPTPWPIRWFKGWIAFLSDRDGGTGLYVMRPDGRGVRRLSDEDMEKYKELREKERRSPDGTTRVYAEAAREANREDTEIYIFRDDLPPTWERRFRLTDWGSSFEYDPVWAPNNEWIAFVSNVTGNDEIWKIRTDGAEPTQLTFNTWEWDKHPTWSPDSQRIAFYSNRITGRLQIWVMNADGSEQRNISRNEYNDWDPVWLK
ncbi:MAG: tetratricopeptide repeat protein [Chloroflexi bacterium]|nr:tetratricopeptide repeat protein [Chloroflexota bacterium]